MNDIEILYEDNHIIVAVKPPGILSQEDKTGDPDMLTLLKKYLVGKYNKPGDAYLGLVHRLDRGVGYKPFTKVIYVSKIVRRKWLKTNGYFIRRQSR
jgi:hypothetical protein